MWRSTTRTTIPTNLEWNWVEWCRMNKKRSALRHCRGNLGEQVPSFGMRQIQSTPRQRHSRQDWRAARRHQPLLKMTGDDCVVENDMETTSLFNISDNNRIAIHEYTGACMYVCIGWNLWNSFDRWNRWESRCIYYINGRFHGFFSCALDQDLKSWHSKVEPERGRIE